jgi:hypothetical protein
MTGRVPLYPPSIEDQIDGHNRIRAALPVYGRGQWRPLGSLANWIIGRGAPLVVAG